MTKNEALNIAIDYMNERLEEHDAKFQRHPVAEAERNNILADIEAVKEALAQPEQEPVAMKFKIYKPTVPDPTRQGINNALLPWVYDQDRSSGFDASMWVTPVATLPPQRKPLTDEEIIASNYPDGEENGPTIAAPDFELICFARQIEAAHGIKENT